MNLAQLIKKNSVILFNTGSLIGTMLVTSGLGFAYWWVAARYFSTEAVGLASAATSAMMLLSALFLLGQGTLLISELPRNKGQEGSLISASTLLVAISTFVAGIVFAILAPFISPQLRLLGASPQNVLQFALGVSLTGVTIILDQAVIGLLRGGVQLWRNTLFAIAKLILVIVVGQYLVQKSGISIYTTWTVSNLLSLLPIVIFLIRQKKWSLKYYVPQWGMIRKLGVMALQHHILNLILQAPAQLLPILVTILLSAKMNAWFYIASMIANFVFALSLSLTTVLHAANAARAVTLTQKARLTVALSLLASFTCGVFLLIAADPILRFFGPSYAEQAAASLRILVLGSIPLTIKNHYIAISRIKDQVGRAIVPIIIGSLLELALSALGIRLGGLTGLSLGWVGAMSLEALLMLPLVLRTLIGQSAQERHLDELAAAETLFLPALQHFTPSGLLQLSSLGNAITLTEIDTLQLSALLREKTASSKDKASAQAAQKQQSHPPLPWSKEYRADHADQRTKTDIFDQAESEIYVPSSLPWSTRRRVNSIADEQTKTDMPVQKIEERPTEPSSPVAEVPVGETSTTPQEPEKDEAIQAEDKDTGAASASGPLSNEPLHNDLLESKPLYRTQPSLSRRVRLERQFVRPVAPSSVPEQIEIASEQERDVGGAKVAASAQKAFPLSAQAQDQARAQIAETSANNFPTAQPAKQKRQFIQIVEREESPSRNTPHDIAEVSTCEMPRASAASVPALPDSPKEPWGEGQREESADRERREELARQSTTQMSPAKLFQGQPEQSGASAIIEVNTLPMVLAAQASASIEEQQTMQMPLVEDGKEQETQKSSLVSVALLYLLPIGAFLIWFLSLNAVHVRQMNDLGLVSVFPPSLIAALAVMSISFCYVLRQPKIRNFWLILHFCLLIFMLYGVNVLVEEMPRFAIVYRHAGYTEFIMRTGTTDPTLDAYFSWPGFFTLSAFLTRIAGYSDILTYAPWAPVFYNLLYFGPLYMLFNAFTRNKRIVWLALWFFYLTNWIGQDYFSPQGLNFFLYLVIIAILVRWFKTPNGQAPRLLWSPLRKVPLLSSIYSWLQATDADGQVAPSTPGQRQALIVCIIVIFGFVVFSHQLTPFFVILSVGALVVCRRCRLWWLPIVLIAMTVGWLLIMTRTYLAGHQSELLGSLGHLFSSFSQNVSNRVVGNAQHAFIAKIRLLMSALVWGCALVGGVVRLRKGYKDATIVLLAVMPFPLFIVQPYGGEMLLRSYLFSLPAMVFLAASFFYCFPLLKRSYLRMGASCLLCLILLGGFLFTRYGNESMDYMTRDEVNGVRYLYSIAPTRSTFVDAWLGVPWQIKDFEKYSLYTTAGDDTLTKAVEQQNVGILSRFLKVHEGTRTYIIFTRSQKESFDATAGPTGVLEQFEEKIAQSGDFNLIYQNPDAQIFQFVNITDGGGAP